MSDHYHDAIKPIDCGTVPIDTEPHFAVYEFPDFNRSAVVDFPPWAPGNRGSHAIIGGLFDQILSVEPNEVFIDVGANIGQMALAGLVGGKTTFAFDPLEYDIKKICAGMKETLGRGWTTQEAINQLHLYRALVGNESQTNVSISRPDDSFGKFEQASLFPGTIGVARKPKSMVKEFVPMVRLDEVIPSDVPIGLVKIDVQGFEWPVVQGMKGLLERKSGYPKIIHYEEQARITRVQDLRWGRCKPIWKRMGTAVNDLAVISAVVETSIVKKQQKIRVFNIRLCKNRLNCPMASLSSFVQVTNGLEQALAAKPEFLFWSAGTNFLSTMPRSVYWKTTACALKIVCRAITSNH